MEKQKNNILLYFKWSKPELIHEYNSSRMVEHTTFEEFIDKTIEYCKKMMFNHHTEQDVIDMMKLVIKNEKLNQKIDDSFENYKKKQIKNNSNFY